MATELAFWSITGPGPKVCVHFRKGIAVVRSCLRLGGICGLRLKRKGMKGCWALYIVLLSPPTPGTRDMQCMHQGYVILSGIIGILLQSLLAWKLPLVSSGKVHSWMLLFIVMQKVSVTMLSYLIKTLYIQSFILYQYVKSWWGSSNSVPDIEL